MKYTIELTDTEYNVLTGFMDMISTEIKAEYFQKAKLELTEKAWEDKLAEAKEFAYKNGLEDGNKIADKDLKEIQDSTYDVAYNEALKDVNHAMDVLENMTETEREEWFEDYASVGEVVRECTIQQIIESTKEYEEKKKAEKESIKVGDEVLYGSSKLLVTKITNASICTVNADGKVDTWRATAELIKTGRHFKEVSQLLDNLKGE